MFLFLYLTELIPFLLQKSRTNLQIIYYSKSGGVLVAHKFQMLLKFIKIKLFSNKVRIAEHPCSKLENI